MGAKIVQSLEYIIFHIVQVKLIIYFCYAHNLKMGYTFVHKFQNQIIF